ncbi:MULTISPECIES: hypothetical protein [Chromobacterium]|uniref:hypothetical protein n=1 Tax=Chromobacterium TaxID=535 RepID=UPI0005BB6075|nr:MULTISPECIES: hypothetical protein [Chromobacterium]UGA39272.1 hypothetical protein JOS77_06810 [Chromobacterium haemolyticum]UJB33725.1 excisionase [Chromobacterium sp. Beijing]BBH14573.1 hypothetical protein CH06BL_38210 [Chromobacterium haemolyticum]
MIEIGDNVKIHLEWLPQARYCEIMGDTPDGVRAKRRGGVWRENVEWRIAGDGKVWVNIKAVQEWAASSRAPKARHAA